MISVFCRLFLEAAFQLAYGGRHAGSLRMTAGLFLSEGVR